MVRKGFRGSGGATSSGRRGTESSQRLSPGLRKGKSPTLLPRLCPKALGPGAKMIKASQEDGSMG